MHDHWAPGLKSLHVKIEVIAHEQQLQHLRSNYEMTHMFTANGLVELIVQLVVRGDPKYQLKETSHT